MDEPLHPRHPGKGCSTSIIAAEAKDGDPEVGGFFIFFPSGSTKVIQWRQVRPIEPTLDAAKQFAAKLIEDLQAKGQTGDIDRTNWASVTAAIQRVILDWNDTVKGAINAKMLREFSGKGRVH